MFDHEAREAAQRARRHFERGIQAALPALRRALGDVEALDRGLAQTRQSLLRQVRDGIRKATGHSL